MSNRVDFEEQNTISASAGQNDDFSEQKKREMREQLQSDVESFLQQGGQVQKIEDNVRADPPRKPTINYGTAPI
ncbi:MAG: hypothetical protein MI864_10345 [Pseudomonadales bacterium]|nr:hypothetical protein [Pseudomonadales bacterium]